MGRPSALPDSASQSSGLHENRCLRRFPEFVVLDASGSRCLREAELCEAESGSERLGDALRTSETADILPTPPPPPTS